MEAKLYRGVLVTRREQVFLSLVFLAWLLYTRFNSLLMGYHLHLPGCIFLRLTGHPCPLCGGTRAFVSLWNGDISTAIHYYPLSPLIFAGFLIFMSWTLIALLNPSKPELRISPRIQRTFLWGGIALIGASWVAKLAYLGN